MLPFPLRLVAAIAVGLLLTACGGAANQAASQPIKPANLKTATVQRQAVADEVMFDGTLEALHQSTVASETNARVTELPFDVNDFVKQGEVIVRFRDTDQKARLASAEAALSGANAHYTDARLEQERIQQLYEKKLVPKSQMDSANAAMESAKAQVDAAIAGKKQAAEQLEHTVVRAPYSGIVLARHIHVGETATVGQPLMTGVSLDSLRAVVEIPQQNITPLREHQKARVILPDGTSINATQVRIPPSADPTTHSFRTLVSLPEGEHNVFPGTLVKVAFVSGEADRLVVPSSAVVRRGEVTGVYLVGDDGRVSFNYVRLGAPTPDGLVPVRSGVSEGESVAMDPIAAGIAYKDQHSETGAGSE